MDKRKAVPTCLGCEHYSSPDSAFSEPCCTWHIKWSAPYGDWVDPKPVEFERAPWSRWFGRDGCGPTGRHWQERITTSAEFDRIVSEQTR